MRIVVYPHDLGIGGSQLNAIELAAAVRDRGHDVLVFGRPGALVSRVEELGLEFVSSPIPGRRPSFSVARALADLVRSRSIDSVHGSEWPPALDAALSMLKAPDVRVVATVMSMSVPPFIPRSIPLVVGTEEIADAERQGGRERVSVIEPPVDLLHNNRSVTTGVTEFCSKFGLDDSKLNVISVGRFARELKLEGILTAIDVVGEMSASVPIRLVLVGDGPAREDVEAQARRINRRYGDETVILTGQLYDPRPAYAAADIALGMGGSALRAMAYGVPLIVQGEQGFWRALRPDTVDQFLWTGWYGVGDGPGSGPESLAAELTSLLAAEPRAASGQFALALVHERFSMSRAALVQEEIYRLATEADARGVTYAEFEAAGRYAQYYATKLARRLLGREATDDFNARPVAAREGRRHKHGF